MARVRSVQKITAYEDVPFSEVREWFDAHLAPSVIDTADEHVMKHVYHDGRFLGVFQCTERGAQKFFMRAKPDNVYDIAALTAIFRPGPLAAHVDKQYVEAKLSGVPYDWGYECINTVLKKTHGFVIFQEQVMQLAEHVALFPKQECDRVRRAIMKRSLEKLDQNRAEVDAIKFEFVAGALKNGVDEKTATKLYENIQAFSGYAFNFSHALSYAFDSYYCAWLMTYHEDEWLAAYMDNMSTSPERKAKAAGELAKINRRIAKLDVNEGGIGWTCTKSGELMPSLSACTGVGDSAVREIMLNRPYTSIEDLLWNSDGTWRHSKFNKKALETLINIEALDSLNCVGDGKLFSSYAHMHHVIVENMSEIKKTPKKEPGYGMRRMYEIARETRDTIEPWSPIERAEKMMEHLGSVDASAIVPASIREMLDKKQVLSIDDVEEQELAWFVVSTTKVKKTKKGKDYLLLEVMGPASQKHKLFVWNWSQRSDQVPCFSTCIADVKKSDMGFSTSFNAMRVLT